MTEAFIITGVTCSGKTRRAIELAKEIGGEIISCDSVQVYRGMDIGSAKATPEELAEVPHHLIDVAECGRAFDVAEYARLAKAALDGISARGKKAVVCGGSGFYLRSWFAAVADGVKIPEDVRKICGEIENSGEGRLAEALLKIDPDAARTVDIQNPRRAKNALARCMATGKTCAKLAEEFAALPCPMGEISRNVRILDVPDEELSERIRERTRQMVSGGLIAETEKLLARGIKNNPSAASAIGYRETIAWLENCSRNERELEEQIARDTEALVKKQRKYFKNSLLKNAQYRFF